MDSTAQSPGSRFEGHAELPGVRLWYVDSGASGVPLVLLHANTGNADGWQYNIPGFVEAGYRAIAFDRRGWGRSTANPAMHVKIAVIACELPCRPMLKIAIGASTNNARIAEYP